MSRDVLLQLSAGVALTAPAHLVFAQPEHNGAADDGAADELGAEGTEHAAEDTTHATTGDGHEAEVVGAIPSVAQGIATGITAVVVFALVLGVLWAKVWPTITKGLDERVDKIKGEIEAAAAARRQAADALETYQQNLAEARAEAQKMLDDTRLQQQQMAADLKAKADVELGDMRDKARRDIEAAKRAALNEIYADAATLATQIAGKILSREVTSADHERLVEESLAELQQAAAASN
jgi:F-type H+-transporting ATPase subunit b